MELEVSLDSMLRLFFLRKGKRISTIQPLLGLHLCHLRPAVSSHAGILRGVLPEFLVICCQLWSTVILERLLTPAALLSSAILALLGLAPWAVLASCWLSTMLVSLHREALGLCSGLSLGQSQEGKTPSPCVCFCLVASFPEKYS